MGLSPGLAATRAADTVAATRAPLRPRSSTGSPSTRPDRDSRSASSVPSSGRSSKAPNGLPSKSQGPPHSDARPSLIHTMRPAPSMSVTASCSSANPWIKGNAPSASRIGRAAGGVCMRGRVVVSRSRSPDASNGTDGRCGAAPLGGRGGHPFAAASSCVSPHPEVASYQTPQTGVNRKTGCEAGSFSWRAVTFYRDRGTHIVRSLTFGTNAQQVPRGFLWGAEGGSARWCLMADRNGIG